MSGPRLVRAQGLFTTPLYLYQLEASSTLNPEIAQEAYALQAQSKGVNRSNQKGWHSKGNVFTQDTPGVRALCGHLVECLTDVVARTRPTDSDESYHMTCSGWININPQHAFNVPHDHPGHVWSGSYYVKVPRVPDDSRSGSIEFLDPRMNAQAIPGSETKYPIKYRMSPEEGSVVIFPSYLRHWVYPNDESEDRISVAFNCTFAKGGLVKTPIPSEISSG